MIDYMLMQTKMNTVLIHDNVFVFNIMTKLNCYVVIHVKKKI